MEASSGEIDSAASGVVRWPVRVETGHYAHPVAPEVYDCVKFLLTREGSGTITGDWGERRFRMGDLMLVGSGLAIGGAPDGTATTSTIFADKDYVMDQVYWRYADVLQDRTAAETVMQRAFGTGAIMIRLNGPLAATFAARIDEIERAQTMREFHRMQAAFAEVLHLLGQLLPWSPAPSLRILTHGIAAMVARRTATRPVRSEVLQVRNAIQCDLAHRWLVAEMATTAHLSVRQLQRVFAESLGVSPITFLGLLRTKEMARMLRDTEMTVGEMSRAVGWRSRSHARSVFAMSTGMTPEGYRQMVRGRDHDA